MRADRPSSGSRLFTFTLLAILLGVRVSATALADNTPVTATPASEQLTASQLASRINDSLAAIWKQQSITPAPPADDAEFLRRVYLDVTGKIPSVAEDRAFLDTPTSLSKRRKLVASLLNRGSYAAHFANTWRDLMLGPANQEARALAPALEMWLRVRFTSGVGYDRLVRQLLTTAAPQEQRIRLARFQRSALEPSPQAYFAANEQKADQLAASTSRVFLGVQVGCAQCHDHPFATWKQKQFWSYAAFFKDLDQTLSATPDGGVRIPDSSTVVQAAFLDGQAPDAAAGAKLNVLASWMTSPENRYFARTAVNRVWDNFFGRPLVSQLDTPDELSSPAGTLLDEIAHQLVLHRYDLKYLVRAITETQAYQLSSQSADTTPAALTHFARMPLRRMTGDQLFESIVQATQFRQPARQRSMAAVAVDDVTSIRGSFQAKFGDQTIPRTESGATILQALSLMNGAFIAGATSLERSETLAAVVDAPFLDRAGRIETLYLAALSRKPEADELARIDEFMHKQGPVMDERRALADLFWALLNSAEFAMNH